MEFIKELKKRKETMRYTNFELFESVIEGIFPGFIRIAILNRRVRIIKKRLQTTNYYK